MGNPTRREFVRNAFAGALSIPLLPAENPVLIKEKEMQSTKHKIGMGQMLVEGGMPEKNLERACRMVEKAAEQECKIVVLPECLDIGWTHPAARELAQSIPGKHSEQLVHVAKGANIYIVAGLVERAGEFLYNSAILISPEGQILLKHRKINELTIGLDLYSIGDSLSVVQTPLGKIGINICADNFPSSLALGHSLARMGAQIILSPCAWAVDADHDNQKDPYGGMWRKAYAELARLYDITVIGVSNVGWLTAGPWRGRKCIGCSIAINREGRTIAQGHYGDSAEDLISVEVEIIPRTVMGTDIAGMLKKRGYDGP